METLNLKIELNVTRQQLLQAQLMLLQNEYNTLMIEKESQDNNIEE